MTFLWPRMLLLLLTVPALVGLYLYLMRRRRRTAVRYASLLVVKEALGSGPGLRRHVPPLLLLGAWTVMVLALARPAAIVTLPSQRGTVVLAMDVSGSMRAADVEPDRLRAAQEAAKAFVLGQPRTTRVGVVAFAGTAMLVQGPTLEREQVVAAIERFRLQRGTNIGQGMMVALQTIFPDMQIDDGTRFYRTDPRGRPLGEAPPPPEVPFQPVEPGSHTSAAIVLLTDGQPTTGPDPIDIARMAADRGVRVFTVGFGSRAGETVGFGGMSMRVQLDEETLRQVAEITRGRYFHAASSGELEEIYGSLTEQFMLEREQMEVTAFFTAAAALLMLAGAGLSVLWFGRLM